MIGFAPDITSLVRSELLYLTIKTNDEALFDIFLLGHSLEVYDTAWLGTSYKTYLSF